MLQVLNLNQKPAINDDTITDASHFNLCLVLVQPRMTPTDMTETLLTACDVKIKTKQITDQPMAPRGRHTITQTHKHTHAKDRILLKQSSWISLPQI